MSLYQKYRAKSFDEIITQDHVTSILKQSLKEDSLSHAYLFVGTRGAGKTSMARIFARALNCSDTNHVRKTGNPCNKCESCTLSLNSAHPDIIEMDAASNRGIEEVRTLKESVDFIPSLGKYKVYIIDEVHMMTKEAFNALLKTLEEPPKHVVFVFCTTESNKIPQTILSRSMIFELKSASVSEIVQKLAAISKGEKREADDKALEIIAKLGKGSFRDAESLLEKIFSSVKPSEKILYEDVQEILGRKNEVLVLELFDSIIAKNPAKVINSIQTQFSDSQVIILNDQLIEKTLEEIQTSLEMTGKLDTKLVRIFNHFNSIYKDLNTAVSPKMYFLAKLLLFIADGDFSTDTHKSSNIQSSSASLNKDKPIKSSNPIDILNSSKTKIEAKSTKESVAINEENSKENLDKDKILEFFKDSKNLLYTILSTCEFKYQNSEILVSTNKRMYVDHLSKQKTIELIANLAKKYDLPSLKIIAEESSDSEPTKKVVEDLNDEDLKGIFK